jgi:metal-dependent amidase/aminoacylase/carboxypeptidase family protein
MKRLLAFFTSLSLSFFSMAGAQENDTVAIMADKIEPEVIKWRHHLHQNPELSNREFETAKYIEAYLRGLGLEVTTGVAITGVVAILD